MAGNAASKKMIIGISVGVACFIFFAALMLVLLLCRRRRAEKQRLKATLPRSERSLPSLGQSVMYDRAPFARPPARYQRAASDAGVLSNGNDRQYRSRSKSNDYVQRAASESSYSRSIRPLHTANEPFSQLQNNRHGVGYQRRLYDSTSALAVVPFRESRLPSSNVSYSVDGRLADDRSDVTSSYSTHISGSRRTGSAFANNHAGNFGLRRYLRSRSADELEARDNISIRAFSDIGPSRMTNHSYAPYHVTADSSSTHEGQWSFGSDVTRPRLFRNENDTGESVFRLPRLKLVR